MNGPRDYHTKWSKTGRQAPFDTTYMGKLTAWCKWTHSQSRNGLETGQEPMALAHTPCPLTAFYLWETLVKE